MKFIPILFSTPMVQAILEGRKTQTRRVCKHQYWSYSELVTVNKNGITQRVDRSVSCPYGKVGDVLWVRESWCLTTPYGPEEYYFGYRTNNLAEIKASEKYDYHSPDEWKPSIHMPKEACRIFLEITNIRVDVLMNISEEDAKQEGTKCLYDSSGQELVLSHRDDFESLWESINGEGSFDANPWVWVIEFKKIAKPSNFPA